MLCVQNFKYFFDYKKLNQRMFSSTSNQKINNAQTKADFYTHTNDESFSYQVEMEKQYVIRLKSQRQKIQALYTKYDVILSQMKRKDQIIKQKDQAIIELDSKVKNLHLTCQEMQFLKQENKQFLSQNVTLKKQLNNFQLENQEMREHLKLKECFISDQKQELQQLNQDLKSKLKTMGQRLQSNQSQHQLSLNLIKQRLDQTKIQSAKDKTRFINEISILKDQIMQKDQHIHMLSLENQLLNQKLIQQEDKYTLYLKELQAKIEKHQKQKKIQIRGLKQSIQQKNNEINSLQSKISILKHNLDEKSIQIHEFRSINQEQKRIFDEDVFTMKSQMTNEKNYYREQFMYFQAHISKLQTKINESLRREKDLADKICRFQVSQGQKRNLRQIQRQQLQKINRILSMQQ